MAERDRGPLGREQDRMRPVLVVLGHRHVAVDRLGQLLRDLPHPVGAEVERDHGVAGPDPRLVPDGRGRDELVGLVALVGRAHGRLAGVGMVVALAVDEQLDGLLGAVPALVAVHREVPSDDRADAADAPALHAGEAAGPGGRRRVAPVGERVDHQILDGELAGELHERLEVLDRGVHAALGDQADEVDARRVPHRLPQGLVLGQRAVRDGGVDAREVLRHDRARAEVEMADLGVAHLALGQADRLALGGELRVRVLPPTAGRTRGCRRARWRSPARPGRGPIRRG